MQFHTDGGFPAGALTTASAEGRHHRATYRESGPGQGGQGPVGEKRGSRGRGLCQMQAVASGEGMDRVPQDPELLRGHRF